MTQINAQLSDEEINKLDNLIKQGVFRNRDEALGISLKMLIEQEGLKKDDLIKGMATVNGFLMDNIGDLPFASNPVTIYYNGKKVYKFPIKTRINWDKNALLGFICVDSETFEIVPELSDSVEKLTSVCEQIEKDLGNTLL